MHAERRYSPLDRLIMQVDGALAAALGTGRAAQRPNPAGDAAEALDSPAERRHVAGLMRVDHAGEVSAQALYQGQGLTAREPAVREAMETAAAEEIDHLVWCEERLSELDSRTSYLNPFWYLGSFSLGAVAGFCGDRWSLGFVAETERQVSGHLQSHLERLPPRDERSRRILEQMKEDEERHGTVALEAGAAELPRPIRGLMRLCSKVMTTTAYYI